MQYFILAFFIVLAFVFFYKIIMPVFEPDFRLRDQLTDEKLFLAVSELARESRQYKEKGKGLSLTTVKRYITRAYKNISARIAAGEECFEFENWIYDNYYKLAERMGAVKKEIHKFGFLPHFGDLPRVYAFANLLVKSCDGYVTDKLLYSAAEVFCAESPFTFAEITALKPALEFALLEYAAIFSSKSLMIDKFTRRAKIDAENEKIDLSLLGYNSYSYALYNSGSDKVRKSMTALCLDNGAEISARLDGFAAMTARYNGRMQSAVQTLFAAQEFMDAEFVASLSPVHKMLLSEPGVVYKQVTLGTKYMYLKRIFALSKKRKISELAVTRTIADAAANDGKDISFYILPKKRSGRAAYPFILAHAATALGLSFSVPLLYGEYYIALAIISLPIFFTLGSMIVGGICKSLFSRRELPSYDLKYRDADAVSTLVTTSRLIGSEGEIDDAFDKMETVIAANPNPIFSYCLLFDFLASDKETNEEKDGKIIEKCKEIYDASEYKDRITLLIRKRKRIDGKEEKYQGWEKKRGALLNLNEYITDGNADAFALVLGKKPDAKYVITLDSDTLTNSCSALVELMEHPYNENKNIISINMNSVADEDGGTLFSRLFRGGTGLDNYSNYSSDVEFDLFDSGNYTGKGIYRVQGFHEKVVDAFADNRILSHDYIEGAYSGCGASRETALDSFPPTYSSFLTRKLRWLRGDWQLLPYLKRKVRNRNGEKVVNPISPISKWHIFSNMMFSLAPVSSLLLIFFSLFMSAPAYICFLAFLLPEVYFLLSVRSSVLLVRGIWAEELLRQIFDILVLPVTAFFNLYSIIITLWRLAVKKKLLEWKVFAHARGRVSFAPSLITAIILVASAAVYGKSIFFYIISAVFAFGYIADYITQKPRKIGKFESKEADDKLREIFYNTYGYFADMLKEENNFLPCDNYQEFGEVGFIRRTSPTNIGYALLSHLCAYEMGSLTLEEALSACEKIVSGIEKLPKWKGNLYNWYDVENVSVLSPPYVSAVDSGNLLSCLYVLLSYCGNRRELKARVKRLIDDTAIEELFDEKRGLFRIGYNSDTGVFDSNHYDLIGSEASLTYLTAVGSGRVGKYAWNNLSRRGVKYGGKTMYRSWTGGMFEYLMCPQFFVYPYGSDLYKSRRNAVLSHIRYAKANKLPFWGISESQYGAVDGSGLYQYKAFGVPDISYANQSDVKVIAPYASLMAMGTAPSETYKNILAMEKFGMRGKYGFYESADCAKNTIQQSYMTHHQGMILLSVCNYLHGGAVLRSVRRLPQFRAAELLLTQSTGIEPSKKTKLSKRVGKTAEAAFTVSGRHEIPYVNLHSCGRYSLVTDENGCGYSLYNGKLLYRYNKRGDGEKLFAESDGKEYNLLGGTFTMSADSSLYSKRIGVFCAETRISVLPSGAGSIREVRLTNLSDGDRRVKIKTLGEIALRDREADMAHPAYSGMFVETAYDEFCRMITAKRVNVSDSPIAAHYIDAGEHAVTYTASRHNYYSRGEKRPDFGCTLDPVFSGSFDVELKAKSSVCFCVYSLVCDSAEELREAVRLTRVCGYTERIRGNNYALAKSGGLSFGLKKTAARILFGSAGSVTDGGVDFGGRPIVAVEVKSESSIDRLKKRLEELKKLYRFGIEFDLYIIYREKHNYFLYLSEWINETLDELSYRKALFGGSRVILLNAEQDKRKVRAVLASAAAIGGPNFAQISDNASKKPKVCAYPNTALSAPELSASLGIGGFTEDGSYFIDLTDCDTPAPWSNIIANETFGTIITESGGGYTYAVNSRENKISRWSNDAVCDEPSEFVALGEGGRIWSVTKKPITHNCPYHVLHSFGVTEFSCGYNGIAAVQKVYISRSDDVKFYDITLKNKVARGRKIDLMFALKPVLGDFCAHTESSVRIRREGNFIVISSAAKNSEAYLSCSEKITGFAQYKESFTDADGNVTKITELENIGSEPFASVTASVILPPNSEKRIIFSVSADTDVDFSECDSVLANAKRYYSSLSDIIPAGNGASDAMLKWLPYQTLCSRFFARAGFYQAGGAFGFRDQLQDCLALLYVNPSLVRRHILRCAAHQFEHGDVQHWWHPPAIGVRTQICDDRLFLPYVTAEYISYTRDYEIMAERVPYLQNVKMQAEETSVYASCLPSSRTESLLEHCLRAIYSTFDFGENGLVKMRGGDWNDAMDKVGERGIGTSVFMSMFLCFTAEKFLPYVSAPDDRAKLLDCIVRLKKAVDKAWDGDRFIRAVSDDGEVLGSSDSPECKIDLLVQSWAALSGAADAEKTDTALMTAYRHLADRENSIIKLLDPPLKTMKNIGYITQYPAGVRENGGQYTHAAVWFIAALIKRGKIEKAWELYNMISPVSHSDTAEKSKLYALEPYVIAADIYSGEFAGRGGWSWYTGSASWYYLCFIEGFLGIKRCGARLGVNPNLPSCIKEYEFDYKCDYGTIRIVIDNSEKEGEWRACSGKIVYGTSDIELNKTTVGRKYTIKRIK